MNGFKEITVKEAYNQINFRESHNSDGKLTFENFKKSKEIMNNLDVYDLELRKLVKIKDL